MRWTCCAGAIQTIASRPASGGRPIIGLFNRSLLTNASTELLYSSGVSDNDRHQCDSSDLGQCGSQIRVASYHPVYCNVRVADNPGLETVTQQLLNESEGMEWRGAGRVHDVDLAVCLWPPGIAAFFANIEPTITPVVLVNG